MKPRTVLTVTGVVVVIGLVVLTALLLRPPGKTNTARSSTSTTCWDGSGVSEGNCPPLESTAALRWVIPRLKSGSEPTCTKRSPTDFSPVATSEEILRCEWAEHPNVRLEIERYATPRLAAEGFISFGEDWVVDGKLYGKTMYTAGGSGAQRWWYYKDSNFVLDIFGQDGNLVDTLASEFDFRALEEIRTGRS